MERINRKVFKKSPAELEAYMAFKHRGGKKPPKKGKGIGSLFLEWFNNATSDPEYENETANNDQ